MFVTLACSALPSSSCGRCTFNPSKDQNDPACRLVMTPLGSKLTTLGAGLACFEMRPTDLNAKYGAAIAHAEPTRYIASIDALRQSRPDISALLLTGEAYR